MYEEKPSEFNDWSIYKKKLHNYSDLFIWLYLKSGEVTFKIRRGAGTNLQRSRFIYKKKQKV